MKISKFKKRFIAILSAAALLVSSLPISAAGIIQTADTVFSIEDSSGKPGGTVTLKISVEGTKEISGLLLYGLQYENDVFEFTGFKNYGKLVTDSIAGEASVSKSTINLGYNPNMIPSGEICTAEFKIKDDAPEGNYTIDFQTAASSDNGIGVSTSLKSGTISVSRWMRGDFDENEVIDMQDAVHFIGWVNFSYIPGLYNMPYSGNKDFNHDGTIDMQDAVYLIGWINFSYIPGLYDIDWYGTSCAHQKEHINKKEASCTEDGNIEYWYCALCDKYFSDEAGMHPLSKSQIIIPGGHTYANEWSHDQSYHWHAATCGHTDLRSATAAHTFDADGKCTVCSYVNESTSGKEYKISYKLYEYNKNLGDDYLPTQTIDNSENPTGYSSDETVPLKDLDGSEIGYQFLGWFTAEGEKVTKILGTMKEDITLWAHWEKLVYKVTFDSPYKTIASVSRTVDEITLLPGDDIMQWDGYVWMGWSNWKGEIITSVPAGTKNITVHANYTSQRNQARPNNYAAEGGTFVFDEENQSYIFIYDLGKLVNVPLYKIKDFGYTMRDGIDVTNIEIENTKMGALDAKTVNETISDATTKSSSWMLSEDWNNTIDEEEREGSINSLTNTIMVSNSSSGSSTSSGSSSDSGYSQTTTKNGTTSKDFSEDKWNVEAEVKASWGPVSVGVSGGYSSDKTHEETGYEDNFQDDYASWNSESSFSKSSGYSNTHSTTQSAIETISKEKGYKTSKSIGGAKSEEDTVSAETTKSSGYSNLLQFTMEESLTDITVYNCSAATTGYYTLYRAGTVHVFGIVIYDIKSHTYSTVTHSILDDDTYNYMDYSTVPEHNDFENAALPFVIPFEVSEKVAELTACTEGLRINRDGEVFGYNGTSKNVRIPDYVRFDNGDGTYDLVKVTSLRSGVFTGKDILSIRLSNYITEIPDKEFKNCTSLGSVEMSAVTSIGSSAFSDCISLKSVELGKNVSAVGENAFLDVDKVTAAPGTAKALSDLTKIAAKNLILNLNELNSISDTEFDFNIKDALIINGYGKTLTNVMISSAAKNTTLNRMTFINNNKYLKLTSNRVMLYNVNIIDARSITMLFDNDETEVILQGISTISTKGKYALISKALTLKEEGMDEALLKVTNGAVAVCGPEITDKALLNVTPEYITITEYENILTSHTITFDPCGGTLVPEETVREVSIGTPYGELPNPAKDYHTFLGWFTDPEGGTQVDADELMGESNVILYAHWEENPLITTTGVVPENAKIISEWWTYDKTETQEFTDSVPSGWEKTDTFRWVQTGSGSVRYASFPSTFDTNHWIYSDLAKGPYTASGQDGKSDTKRDVTNTHTGYVYWKWDYNSQYANRLDRYIMDYRTDYGPGGYAYWYFHANLSTTDHPYINDGDNTYNCSGEFNTSATAGPTPRFYRFNYYTSTYTDYKKVYEYQKVTTGLKSETEISADNEISNVQKHIQYRLK